MYLTIAKYLGAIAVFCLIVWGIHHKGYIAGLDEGKKIEQASLLAQETLLNTECANQKKLTNEVSNAFQTNLSNVDDQLAEFRLHKAPAISVNVPAADSVSGHNATTEGQQPDKRNVDYHRLIEFSGTCEKDRIKVIALQDFIRRVQAAHP